MKQLLIAAAALPLLLAIAPAATFAQPAAGTPAAAECTLMEAEIQALSARMQGAGAQLQANLAEQQAAHRRQVAAATAGALLPIPFVGSAIAGAAGADVAQLQARQAPGMQAAMNDIPALAARMQALAPRFASQCLPNGGMPPAGASD